MAVVTIKKEPNPKLLAKALKMTYADTQNLTLPEVIAIACIKPPKGYRLVHWVKKRTGRLPEKDKITGCFSNYRGGYKLEKL